MPGYVDICMKVYGFSKWNEKQRMKIVCIQKINRNKNGRDREGDINRNLKTSRS